MSDQNKNRRSFINGSVARGLMAADTAALAGLINTPGSLGATETTQPGSTQPGSTQPGTTQPTTTAPGNILPSTVTITYAYPIVNQLNPRNSINLLGRSAAKLPSSDDGIAGALADLQKQIRDTITSQYPTGTTPPTPVAVIKDPDSWVWVAASKKLIKFDITVSNGGVENLLPTVVPDYDPMSTKYDARVNLPLTTGSTVITIENNYG